MGTSIAALKRAAKDIMRGRTLLCVIGACVPMFTVIVGELLTELILYFNLIPLIYLVALLLMIPLAAIPVFMGAIRFFWLMSRGEVSNPVVIFYYFTNRAEYRRVLRWGFSVFLRILRTAVFALFPSVLAYAFTQKDFYDGMHWSVPQYLPLISVFYVALTVAGWIIVGVYMLRYYMIPYLLIAAPELIDEEVSFHSDRIYHATAERTLRYVLSYWPWILLSLLVFPLVFTLPYFLCGYLTYCRSAMEGKFSGQRTNVPTDRNEGSV